MRGVRDKSFSGLVCSVRRGALHTALEYDRHESLNFIAWIERRELICTAMVGSSWCVDLGSCILAIEEKRSFEAEYDIGA